MPVIHKLKTHPEPFKAVKTGLKKFEVRKNDRHYIVNDELLLEEYIPKGYLGNDLLETDREFYTGEFVHRRITYVLPGGQYGIENGYVILGIEPI